MGVGGAWVAVDSVVYHPGFDFVTMSYDVAIVRLAEEVHVTPVPLLRAAKNAPVVGDNVRVAGFGLEGPDDASPASKRSGTSVVSGMYGGDRFVLRGGPSQPCRGDSGGPAFLTVGGDEVLAGITSEGDAECASHSIETRVDAYAGFIDAAISDGEVVAARGGCAVAAGERNPGVPLLTVVCAALAVIRRALRRSRRGDLRVSDDRERQDRHMVNA